MSLLATPAAPLTTPPADAGEAPSRLRGRWPLTAFVAAVAVGAFPGIGAKYFEEDVTDQGPLAVYDQVKDLGVATHISMDLAFLGAIALAVFGAGFLRFLAGRTPQDSVLGPVSRIGVGAAVGLSFAVAILKAIYRGGLDDHMDSAMYTRESVATLHIVIDQFQYTALWPLTLVMGAVVVLSLRHRALPRWYGVFSGLVLLGTLGMAFVLGLPYFAGLAGPLWLVASGIVVLRHRNRPVSA